MPSVLEVNESPFTPKVKGQLQANREKASRDFRSDVVTVPVEEMMKVNTNPPYLMVEGDETEETLTCTRPSWKPL